MKYLKYIIITVFFFSCDTENGSDCFKKAGTIISKDYALAEFSKVIFNEDIELEIRQGSENGIQISYGKNLIENISTSIVENQLIINNSTGCNLVRGYKPAKIILTAINISEIRNASQFKVFSNETIKFNSLTLISEDFLVETTNVGDFELKIENQDLNIISNNVSNFSITGITNNLFINFASGQGKFEGENLVAQNIDVFHRGTNKMIVNPIQQITGEIRSSGNVIAINRPPIVDVEEFYTGKLIFRN
jgi:hypothetical protein